MIAGLASSCGSVLVGLSLAGVEAKDVPLELEARVFHQFAIEQVYARHRSRGDQPASGPSAAAVRRRAEDAVLMSIALEDLWGVTITGERLQAELDRMGDRSQAPEVLRELFDAVQGDPELAAECLARPLLADRLIRSHYAADSRFHGELEAQARRELTACAPTLDPQKLSGVYSEVEWRRGHDRTPGVVGLEPEQFDQRVREIERQLGGPDGRLRVGCAGPLRDEGTRFVAQSVLAMDGEHLRLAIVEWPKQDFDSWWLEERAHLRLQRVGTSAVFLLPSIPLLKYCRDDCWKPTQQLLDPRYWHTAVWTGAEMIVFGGMEAAGFLFGDGSRYDPATDTWRPLPTVGGPGARRAHVAVWTGSEMLVWGGRGDQSGGRYDPLTDAWTPMSTTNAPTPRWNASVVWTGSRMVVWGGDTGGGTLNSGGSYDPASDSWKNLAGSPLAPRAYHAAAWTGSEMVVWGGYNVYGGLMYADGARYDPVTNSWSAMSTTHAPNARFYHTAVWTGHEVVVWGGLNYPTYDRSGGRYDPLTDSWRPTSLLNAPSLRWFHAAVWTGSEMIVQGGTPSDAAGGRYDPVTDTWTPTSPVNAADNGQGITGVWTGTEMIVWGGLDDDFVFHGDGGRYDPAQDTWHPTSTMNVPTARGLHSAEWTGSEMVVWGGYSYGYPNTGGVYDPATDSWRPTNTVGAPQGRENATAVWTGAEVVIWGGDPDGNPGDPGTGGIYDPASDSWRQTSTSNAATSRYGHTAVWTGQEMIVFGGVYAYPYGLAKRFDPATNLWSNATLANAPGQREHHAAVWTGSEMIVWGGYLYDGSTPTGGRYDPATDTWARTNVTSSPAAREWPIGVWTGQEMIVWGGHDWLTSQDLGTGGRYDPSTDTWKPTKTVGAPTPRVAQGVWTGKELVLWGGANDSSGGRYDPASNSWRPTTLVEAPDVLWGGRWSTVWTGQQMILWGGMGPTQKGALYCSSYWP